MGRIRLLSGPGSVRLVTWHEVRQVVDSQADWQQGILDGVVATAAGDLVLALGSGNLALNKPATASSVENNDPNRAAQRANDGNQQTRWASARSDPQWWQVDLGAPYPVWGCRIFWEVAAAKNYKIQYSNDGEIWSDVYEFMNGGPGPRTDNLSWAPVMARYWRMYGIARATIYGYSMWEIEFYGGQSGYRVSPVLDLSSVDSAASSSIAWAATTPPGTSVTVETRLSMDGGTTWGLWQQATNGGPVPGVTAGMDLSSARLQTRATLATTDTTVTPTLHRMDIRVVSPPKPGGRPGSVRLLTTGAGRVRLLT